jgi:hypothetical protein
MVLVRNPHPEPGIKYRESQMLQYPNSITVSQNIPLKNAEQGTTYVVMICGCEKKRAIYYFAG